MKLLRMQATFGKLDGDVLELQDGLNVITAPNEAGKSTWSAFLMAMLYGIDTTQRSGKDTLAEKARYQPWSGKPMAGRLDLEWQGRRITIERSTKGRTPLGEFRAYETDTGLPVPELTAQTCGQTLTGATRAVFARSAFLAQADHTVSFDQTLEQRLQELVSDGDEGVTFHQAEKQLQQLQNRCTYHKSGLIPEAEARLEQVNTVLEQLTQLEQEARHTELELARQRAADRELRDRQSRQNREALEAARAQELEALQAYQTLQAELPQLPDREKIQSWQRRIQELAETPVPEMPMGPQALRDLAAPEAAATARRDSEQAQAWESQRPPALWSRFLPLLLLIPAVLLRQNMTALLICGGLAVGLTVVLLLVWLRQNKHHRTNVAQLHLLLDRYQAKNADEIMEQSREYLQQLRVYQEQQGQSDAAALAQKAALLAEITPYRPVTQLGEAAEAAQQALQDRERLENAVLRHAAARQHHTQLQAALAGTVGGPSDREQTLAGQLENCRGRIAALGQRSELEAQREQLTARLAQLRQYYDAAGIALDALRQARDTLQARFAPALRRLTAQYLADLTGGAHGDLQIDRQMRLELQDPNEPAGKASIYYSAGTRDQIYLALRLAIAQLLLEPSVPYILDDALVCFDAQRMGYALDLLREQARQRQIILFSCQDREQQYLRSCAKETVQNG